MPHALLVEDDERLLRPLTRLAARQGYSSASAGTLREARNRMEQQPPDVLLLDTSLPDGSGLELLRDSRASPRGRVIVMTESPVVEGAMTEWPSNVCDCLAKPVDIQRVEHHLHTFSREAQRSAPAQPWQVGFGAIIGQCPAMRQVYDMIRRVAPTTARVLLIGETGTGKELTAQAIHEHSRRRHHPFVAVNCGAMPENLIESELFGHEKGAFTGAAQARAGVFERATGGTLFLDEITEMRPDLQVRLLRVLETMRVMRLGASQEIDIDVRVIAATNRDPQQAVAGGLLREDLYYRLAVFPLVLPPLRERGGDVELLAHHLLEQFNDAAGAVKRYHPRALEPLKLHAWPGNVRELSNVMQRAHILADEVIDGEQVRQCLEAVGGMVGASQPLAGADNDNALRCAPRLNDESIGEQLCFPIGTSLAEAERRMIFATLRQLDGDKRRAARTLGISLKTLYNRLNAYSD